MYRSRGKYAIISFLFIFLSFVVLAQSLTAYRREIGKRPRQHRNLYQRYVKRHPPMHPDDKYTEDVVEIFHVRHRPPSFLLSDDEIDRIIRCDFEPHLKECEKFRKDEPPIEMPPLPPLPVFRPTTFKPKPPVMHTTTTRTTMTTKTTTTSPRTPIFSPEDNWPLLPDIPIEPEINSDEYDDNTEKNDIEPELEYNNKDKGKDKEDVDDDYDEEDYKEYDEEKDPKDDSLSFPLNYQYRRN